MQGHPGFYLPAFLVDSPHGLLRLLHEIFPTGLPGLGRLDSQSIYVVWAVCAVCAVCTACARSSLG